MLVLTELTDNGDEDETHEALSMVPTALQELGDPSCDHFLFLLWALRGGRGCAPALGDQAQKEQEEVWGKGANRAWINTPEVCIK